MKAKKHLILLLLACIISILTMGSVSAADTYVNGSIGDDTGHSGLSWDQAFNTIKEGYNTVTEGNAIYIAAGTYTENDDKNINIDKSITIQGAGEDKTAIDCEGSGRAFTVNAGKTVTIKDLTVKNGYLDPGAGSAIDNRGNLTVERCTFKDNTAHNSVGGAISSSGTLNVNDCLFDHNIAHSAFSGEGGAIWNYQGLLTVVNSEFKDNEAFMGGAIRNNDMDNTATITGCIFTGNKALGGQPWYGYGGAINNFGSMFITNSIFTNNNANKEGGAIFTSRNLTVTGCNFTINTAAFGGAIKNTNGNLTVTGCNFNSNPVNYGGAICNNDICTVNSSTFTGNSAQTDGGAIYNTGTLTATGCNFNSNSAGVSGGAISSLKEQGGGSILAFNGASYDVNVKYSRFVGNTAKTTGQDINMNSGTLNAQLNWWGSNSGPAQGRVIGSTNYAPWLMLNIYAEPTTIYTGGTSTITANVYKDSAGGDHSADAAQFFSGPQITFTTTLGKIGSDSITVPWVLGRAVRPLVANEGPGTAHVTAADGQVVSTDVTMLQAPRVNAATVGMQETGVPVAGLILAVLMLVSGLVISRK